MSILSDFSRNLTVTLLLFGIFHFSKTDFLKTTSTTIKPPVRAPGLSLPLPNSHPPKCTREVPAIFSQYEKDVPIVGNSTTNSFLNVIEVCCRGFKRYEYDWSMCVPDCGNMCLQNGFCIDGGKCMCFDEFVHNYRNICVPTCPLGCPHGQCYLNGTCVCNEGFILDPSKKFCQPECDPICGHNEICIEPNKCICADGYAKSIRPDSTMGCQPVCIPDCGFGHCIAPNECKCFDRYEKRMNGTACESPCYMRCEHGFCVNQTTCICQNGYKYDYNTTSCLPDCDDNCENGICISPGVCRCFNGYEHNGIKCSAICENTNCGYYGKCIAPDICGCNIIEGRFKSYQRCEEGFCNAKGRCRCKEGRTRFINQCVSTDKVTTYASMNPYKMNEALINEFNLLIGQHFMFRNEQPNYFYG
ncbi:tenascin [Teleopsis dalmanni]|uniref:tenascin n=1 Tax=Teleopsis dalmanni TaxID=139649 RepID=UPI000D32B7D9|nr:tenascin [Teleopsis dalmanni]